MLLIISGSRFSEKSQLCIKRITIYLPKLILCQRFSQQSLILLEYSNASIRICNTYLIIFSSTRTESMHAVYGLRKDCMEKISLLDTMRHLRRKIVCAVLNIICVK